MWQLEGGEHSLNITSPKLIRFGSESVLKIFYEKDDKQNQLKKCL